MTNSNETVNNDVLLRAVRDEANAREEQFRRDEFETFLFHRDVATNAVLNGMPSQLEALKRDFLKDKNDNDMFGRLEIALSKKYLGAIHVVELGTTTEPGMDGSADGLKVEYRALRNWMKSLGIIEDEMSREESGRFFDVNFPEATNTRVVIGRTRPLISTLMKTPDDTSVQAQVDIAKRMVFSIPTGLYLAYARTDPKIEQDATMRSIEELLQAPNGKKQLIDPIRTTYYLRTAVRELEDKN